MNRPLPRGFTLVELAVSMVVIGILLGLGMSMVGPLMASMKTRESKENLAAAVESVNSYASGNNRLPDTTTSYPSSTTHWKNVVKTPADAWGRDFIYLYDSNLAPATATKDTICGRRSTVISLTDSNTGATIPNVAYILLSQSDDATTNTKIGTTAVTSGPISTATTVAADTVNDLVRWATLDELRTKVGCQGAQLKIVNNELPFTNKSTAYGPISIAVDGGTQSGNYEWRIKVPPTATKVSGITFTPNLPFTNTSTSNWVAGVGTTPLQMTGAATLSPSGSFSYTIQVRDNQNNTAQKAFVLTVNPR